MDDNKLVQYMVSKKVSRTFTLPVEIDQKIKVMAKKQGIKKYQIISFAIDAYTQI